MNDDNAPLYKLENGELVPLTPEEIAEWQERVQNPPPGPTQPADANARIDIAMQMLRDDLPEPQTDNPDMIRRMDEPQLADYVAGLSTAIRAMLVGFIGRQPRSEPPSPSPATREALSAKRRTHKR